MNKLISLSLITLALTGCGETETTTTVPVEPTPETPVVELPEPEPVPTPEYPDNTAPIVDTGLIGRVGIDPIGDDTELNTPIHRDYKRIIKAVYNAKQNLPLVGVDPIKSVIVDPIEGTEHYSWVETGSDDDMTTYAFVNNNTGHMATTLVDGVTADIAIDIHAEDYKERIFREGTMDKMINVYEVRPNVKSAQSYAVVENNTDANIYYDGYYADVVTKDDIEYTVRYSEGNDLFTCVGTIYDGLDCDNGKSINAQYIIDNITFDQAMLNRNNAKLLTNYVN